MRTDPEHQESGGDGAPMGASAEQSNGMRPWLKVLLALSLTANLAVAGLAVGAALRWHDGEHHGPRPPSVGAMIYRDLDRETRAQLRQRAAGEHGNHADRRRAEAEAVIAALLADPFETGSLEALLRDQSQARFTFQLSVQEAWLRQLGGMSLQERKSYANRLRQTLQNAPGWHRPPER